VLSKAVFVLIVLSKVVGGAISDWGARNVDAFVMREKGWLSGTGDCVPENRTGSSCRSDPVDEVARTLKGTRGSDSADGVAPTLKRTKEFKSAIGCTQLFGCSDELSLLLTQSTTSL
jgi:hypothetical protein